ncbi:hypothetical protein RA27_12030 [Ruegeria sp. ANG-R]|uniref:FAD-dependent oxidoreductase n=1 Tax=Ruegeria sp. ANG-R TaxID=1577903 RepID=UPI00057C525C|nr:NAD(P)/FAD-dependent oxidoreductase [Ruegeria sp. ANG-R]KIC40511.1 hypothetical protein RA27_12030 [Ruegeria sp. ANG-R]
MSESQSIADRVEAQLTGARVRTLIIGAGIAGSTLAALMRQRGERPALIERQGPVDAGGYMLGVLPLGGRVLNGLGLRQRYENESSPLKTYELYNRHGEKPRSYPLAPIVDAYGDWRGISRLAFLNIIRDSLTDIVFDASVKEMHQTDDHVEVTFEDASSVTVDLVVGAEGVHSPTRRAFWQDDEIETFDTGWGGYVLWSDSADLPLDTYSELWSDGWGVGLYPAFKRVGIFVGGNRKHTKDCTARDFITEIQGKVPADSCFAKALAAAEIDETPFFWPMTDIRTKSSWSKGRVVLIGDACASFLPTAGIGASTAMDSAAALSDELSRADPHLLPYALSLFEKRQRHRVDKTQKNSRKLAKLMFVDSVAKTALRDEAMHFYTLKSLVHDISEIIVGD